MYNHIFDINWNGKSADKKITYRDVFLESEQQNSAFIMEHSNIENLFRNFDEVEKQSELLSENNLAISAYEQALKASHILNLLDARGVISPTQRASYILRIRNLVKTSCKIMLNQNS